MELLIALNLERTLGKDRIWEMYLNIICFTRNYPKTIPLINERFGPFSGGYGA